MSYPQFTKFVVVGLFNTVLGYTIYAGITLNGSSASSALIFTYAIAVPLNFFTTGRLVFNNSRMKPLFSFIVAYAGIFILNWAALRLAMNIGLGPLVSQALIVPFISILSYLIFNYSVFRKL